MHHNRPMKHHTLLGACFPGLPFVIAAVLALMACSRENSDTTSSSIEVWAHAGQESERSVLLEQVAQFNAREADFQVRLTLIPEGSYNAQVQAAAVAGGLPDLLELDGPFLYSYVWQGRLQPLSCDALYIC